MRYLYLTAECLFCWCVLLLCVVVVCCCFYPDLCGFNAKNLKEGFKPGVIMKLKCLSNHNRLRLWDRGSMYFDAIIP